MLSKVGKIIFFLLPFLFLFFLLWQKDFEFNEDLGRHIELGKLIVSCHCVPTTNLFTYTFPNFPWFTNSWLAAVIFYETFAHFGKQALLYLKFILITLSFFGLYIYTWKKYTKFWSTVLAIPFLSIFYFRFGLRPEVFSFLLLVLFLMILERYRQTNSVRYIWLLIPLEVLWVNLHIYFIFGLVLYGCLVLEKLLHRKLNASVLLICLLLPAATLVNPLTYKMALLPFTIFHNYGGNLLENMPIFKYFQSVSGTNYQYAVSFLIFELMVALTILSYVVFIVRPKKISVYYLFISLFGIAAAGRMIRFLPVFALCSFLPLIILFQQIEKILVEKEQKEIVSFGKTVFVLLSAGLFIFFLILIQQKNLFGLSFQENYRESADFIQENHIPGPMLNAFTNGAYYIFRLYPEQKVFIDARAEAFPAEFINTFDAMLAKPDKFDALDKQYNFNSIVIENEPGFTSKFIKYIAEKKEWVLVYTDSMGNVIFLRDIPKNAELIKKFAIHKEINVIE